MDLDLAGIDKLKFTTSKVGVDDLESKGWRVLAELKPQDGMTYYLLGLSVPEDPQARLKVLEAEIAALRAGAA